MTLDAEQAARIEAFFAARPEIERVDVLFPDLNGVTRGKWLPRDVAVKKLTCEGVRLPISSYALDIFGEDVEATGLALPAGDPDGVGWPDAATLSPAPFADPPAAQVLMRMETRDGAPCAYDPRQILSAQIARLAARGLTAVAALELEFYLTAPRDDPNAAPAAPPGLGPSQVYDLEAMEACGACLRAIQRAAAETGLEADAAIAEFGPGQFEINLRHAPDALAAADGALLLKRVVRRAARAHGLAASFMAKPYGDQPGSGMHAHVSLLDETGRNVFAAETGVAPALAQAVGGLLATMRPLQAIFLPHLNSYRRLDPGAYAPLAPDWAIEHRGVALRLPATSGPAARFEHRVAGADANPHLALAAILGGALIGLEDKRDPGPPAAAAGVRARAPLRRDWAAAVSAFARSGAAERVFGAELRRVYAAIRRAEIDRLSREITDVERRVYFDRV